jgi:hypothetical protein
MRVSVQLRFRDSEQRWGRSVYVDPTVRTVQVPIGGMRAIGSVAGERPNATAATALLFVIDLTNASPGTSGWLTIRRPALGVLVR